MGEKQLILMEKLDSLLKQAASAAAIGNFTPSTSTVRYQRLYFRRPRHRRP